MAKKTLEAWVNESLNDTNKAHPCSQISLVHMIGQQQKEIWCYKFKGGGKVLNYKELAETCRNKAESYCQEIPGVQSFQLLAFYGTEQPEAFQPFMVNQPADFGGLSTEGPTAQGNLQQQMRHGEMLLQQVYRRQEVLDRYTLDIIREQGVELRNLRAENRDAFAVVKEVMMEQATDQHDRAMQQLTFERSTNERKKWLSFAPALVNTVLGREVFPQSTADTALVEAITESLSEDDILKIAGVLKPEVLGPLAARMEVYQRKKAADEASRERQLPPFTGVSPEEDAGGGE